MTASETTVLVADDHELLRSGLVAVLNRVPGLRVVGAAGSGTEAVALARALHPDVVLMDVRMPGIDGIEATRRILSDREGRTAVVVLTTYDDESIVFAALRAGAVGFVLKDAPTDDVVRAIDAAKGGGAHLSPSIGRRVIRAALSQGTPSGSGAAWEPLLTPRERDVLELVAAGLPNDQIARQLHLAVATVKSHVGSLLLKTQSRTRVDLVLAALGRGSGDRSGVPSQTSWPNATL